MLIWFQFLLCLVLILDFMHRSESVYTRANAGHALSAGFGVILIGFMAVSLAMAAYTRTWAIGHGLYTPVLFLLIVYLFNSYAFYLFGN